MSKRGLLNIILLGIVVALALIVFLKPGKAPPINTKLSEYNKSEINSIKIERVGNPAISFKREKSGWQMLEPYPLKANTITVEALLDLLAYNHHGQYDMVNLDAKKYGLDIPRATITFNHNITFQFGTTEPLNKYRYILYNGKLNLTDDYYFHRILGDAATFLDYALLPENASITRLAIPNLELTQQDGNWKARPEPEKFSNDQANELIENWQRSHAHEITKYDPENTVHHGQVTIKLKDTDSQIQFHIISSDNNFYLARPDIKIKYKLANEKRRDLLQLPATLETPDNGIDSIPQVN